MIFYFLCGADVAQLHNCTCTLGHGNNIHDLDLKLRHIEDLYIILYIKRYMAKRKVRFTTRSQKKKAPKKTRLGSALRYGGRMLGGLVGAGDLGHDAGAYLSRWLGSGDYRVGSNTLLSASTSIPDMHKSNQTVTVRHKEYLGDIFSSSTAREFKIDSYALNPGLSKTFPWLHATANNFTEYEIKGLVFHFKSNSGDAFTSTDASTGSVLMCTQYRASQAAPANKQEILQQYWSQSSAPQTSFVHAIECDPKENPLKVHYIRSGTKPTTDDQMFYDLGTTYIASVGLQGTSVNMGELWVTYEIELKKPQNRDLRSPSSESYHGRGVGTGVSTSDFFATVTTVEQGSFTPTFSADTITLPLGLCGRYFIHYMVRGSSTAGITPPTVGFNGAVATNSFINSSSSAIYNGGTTVSLIYLQGFDIQDPNIQSSIVFENGTLPTSPTSIDVYIIQIPDYGTTFN